jgi:hypothetical protein
MWSRYFCMSNGVTSTGPVRDEQIAAILQRYSIGQAVMSLIAVANANGGPDNVTVLLIEAQRGARAQPQRARQRRQDPGAAWRIPHRRRHWEDAALTSNSPGGGLRPSAALPLAFSMRFSPVWMACKWGRLFEIGSVL